MFHLLGGIDANTGAKCQTMSTSPMYIVNKIPLTPAPLLPTDSGSNNANTINVTLCILYLISISNIYSILMEQMQTVGTDI